MDAERSGDERASGGASGDGADRARRKPDGPLKTAAQGELLFNRLVKRYRHLKKWARRAGTDAFRLYDRDIPEIPLVLDYYGGAVSGALYSRPYEKDEAEEDAWLRAMKTSAARALGIPENAVFLKQRRRMRGRQETGDQYKKLSAQNVYRDVHEGDLVFRANLSDYLDTGLFLDARKKRALIRGEAAGKRVLNLFAYTCSLSVAAAKGGARRVDSVDLSRAYLEWGKINFALNGLEAGYQDEGSFAGNPAAGSGRDSGAEPAAGKRPGRDAAGNAGASSAGAALIRSDAIQFLALAAKKRLRWDLIILDPPSFSNSKKMRGVLDIRRDCQDLIRACLSLLSPGGTLWFSSNARGFDLAGGDFPGFAVNDMGPALADEDFKGKKIPFCYTFLKE